MSCNFLLDACQEIDFLIFFELISLSSSCQRKKQNFQEKHRISKINWKMEVIPSTLLSSVDVFLFDCDGVIWYIYGMSISKSLLFLFRMKEG